MNTITPKADINTNRQKAYLSLKKGNVQQPSFKANAVTLIQKAEEPIMEVFSQHYGNIGNRIGQKLGKLATESTFLKKSARFSLEKGVSQIKDKSVPRALLENAIMPFVQLPLWAGSWVLQQAKKVPFMAEGAEKLYRKDLFRIPRKLNEIDEKTDIIKGIYGKTKSVVGKFAKSKGLEPDKLTEMLNKTYEEGKTPAIVQEANEYIKENLYKVSNKFFDKHTGNFNTAYERPLNRIVSGLIPVTFLANDAYNLSVLCGDSKEESKEEAKERKKQEISRVLTTAYIQLLTFGAFTKQVNTIPWFTPLTSAATVLFSETNSRRKLGKPIFFLSKEKAKEYNKKNKEKGNQAPNFASVQASTKLKPQNNYSMLNSQTPSVFTSFKANNTEDKQVQGKPKEEKKALMNAKTLKKLAGAALVGGIALSFIKNSSYTKNSKIVKSAYNLWNSIKTKIYNPLAFKDFEMDKASFDKMMGGLKEVGCEKIAEGHEFIAGKYAKQTENGSIKLFKKVLPKDKMPDIAASVISSIKGVTEVSEQNSGLIEKAIDTAINSESVAVGEGKFSDVAKKSIDILRKKSINISDEQIPELTGKIAETFLANSKEKAIQVETKVKPFMDMLTEPFKFIGSVARLPFKIVKTVTNIAVSPVEKKVQKSLLGEAQLSKTEEAIHNAVTNIFGEKQAKSGKISQTVLVNAMEQLQKKTQPYLKAKDIVESLTQAGASEAQINAAKQKLAKEQEKLMKYVNVAVEKSFNGVTQSSNKNTDLAIMSKLASSLVTSAFLVADNYNMVMIKSDGEDKENAKEKANERIIQRLSALFYQTMFINWFNATFRSTYNSSLKGMAKVVIPNTYTTEIITRASIGMPIGKKSYEEIQAMEEKNANRKGFLGKYFKFMRLLTGKKPLKDRLPKDRDIKASYSKEILSSENSANNGQTNLLQKYLNK